MVQFLCENSATVGAVASDGMTALHFACQKGHLEAVRVLLAAGAKVTAVTRKGMSPLHFAVQNGTLAVVKVMARKGPQMLTEADKKGQLPLNLAKNDEVKCLLDEVRQEAANAKKRSREEAEGGKKGKVKKGDDDEGKGGVGGRLPNSRVEPSRAESTDVVTTSGLEEEETKEKKAEGKAREVNPGSCEEVNAKEAGNHETVID
eukprot:TRINITY_DN10216_c0_g1_i2.p1 TRINITY_DN10216_c0_g1~~TRINITY_DN10216_c0_g1_i2.p1  ORF type:complete len:204 (+),score=56.75 TRINITY_DN10216_c0_g1_i2:341-952(+)